MRIIGHGIDLIELEKFDRLVNEPDSDFLERCYTDVELANVQRAADRLRRLAGHFAAKEAVAKALGTGFDGAVAPINIEILNEQSGKPCVRLHRAAAEAAGRLGIVDWHLSISHSDTMISASAIAIG